MDVAFLQFLARTLLSHVLGVLRRRRLLFLRPCPREKRFLGAQTLVRYPMVRRFGSEGTSSFGNYALARRRSFASFRLNPHVRYGRKSAEITRRYFPGFARWFPYAIGCDQTKCEARFLPTPAHGAVGRGMMDPLIRR